MHEYRPLEKEPAKMFVGFLLLSLFLAQSAHPVKIGGRLAIFLFQLIQLSLGGIKAFKQQSVLECAVKITLRIGKKFVLRFQTLFRFFSLHGQSSLLLSFF